MASFKDIPVSRPIPQTGFSVRQNNPRHHSHSISLGAVNPNHRVTRRKSVTTNAATNAAAAVAASLKDPNGESVGIPMAPFSSSTSSSSHRRVANGRRGLESSSLGTGTGLGIASTTPGFSSYLSRSMNSASHNPGPDPGPGQGSSVVGRKMSPNLHERGERNSVDGGGGGEGGEGGGINDSLVGKPFNNNNNGNRRASEGSHLVKGEGKRSAPDLRCDRCGKGYKHGSCLSKHMWEHDPAWAVTSKLLISKHQQVQLLEAASVLVNMNQDPTPPNGSNGAGTGGPESETSSASPDASSEIREDLSSAETTPPPMDDDDDDDFQMSDDLPTNGDKRYSVSNDSAGYAHSFQSVPSTSFAGGGRDMPAHSPAFSYFRHSSIDTRPSTADTKLPDEDEADLAAAIRLCNFGTPRTGPVAVPSDVPPVPPLPARFLDQTSASRRSNSAEQSSISAAADVDVPAFPGSTSSLFPSLSFNPSLSYKVSDEREARLGDADRESRHRRNNDVDFGSRHAHADDDDDGVFGRMEE